MSTVSPTASTIKIQPRASIQHGSTTSSAHVRSNYMQSTRPKWISETVQELDLGHGQKRDIRGASQVQSSSDLKGRRVKAAVSEIDSRYLQFQPCRENEQSEILSLKKQVEGLTLRNEKLNIQVDELRNETKKKEDVKLELTEEIEALKKEKEFYKEKLKEATEQNTMKEKQIKNLQEQQDANQEARINLEKENQKLQEDYFGAKQRTKQLFDDLCKARENESNLKSCLEKSEEAKQMIHENYLRLKTHNEQRAKKRVCVMCINEATLRPTANALYGMKTLTQFPRNVEICEKKLQGPLSADNETFQDASMIILVAFPEPRTLLLSEIEPSQLGVIYREATGLQKEVFMIYADAKSSDNLKDSQTYHKSLESLFTNQPAIGELKMRNRFISVKFKEKDNVQKLNEAQRNAIIKWITQCSGP